MTLIMMSNEDIELVAKISLEKIVVCQIKGYLRQVMVVDVERGQRKVKVHLYYSMIDGFLDFDLCCIKF